MVNISVIVATLNRKNYLAQCLEALMNQTYRDFEIIVVDGGSTDGTCELVQNFPVKLVMQDGRCIPNAENCGVMAARGHVLTFTDDDAIAPENWLREIAQTYADFCADGVGGALIDLGPPRQTPKSPSPYLKLLVWLLDGIFSSIVCENKCLNTGLILRSGQLTENFVPHLPNCIPVDHLYGCNMSFRRAVFEAVGLFDEVYDHTAFRFETEFCLRARAKGFKLVYNPRAFVYHQSSKHTSRPEGERLGRATFSNMTNDVLFVLRSRKNIPRFSWIRFAVRQMLQFEKYLRLAIRRGDIAYLHGLTGMLHGIRVWNSNRQNRAGQWKCNAVEDLPL